MKAEIISCGTELLLGHNIDTNAAFLSNSLSRIGIDVFYHTTVGDNKERLSSTIREALKRSDIVIITGGLGPTVDDITAGTLANVINKDLIFNRNIFKDIGVYFKKCNLKLPKSAVKQALIPRGADRLQNGVGTAPGLIIKHEKRYLIALPGPPRELIPMFDKGLLPHLKKLRTQNTLIKSRSIRLTGIPEIKVNEKIKALLELDAPTTVGIYAGLCEVELKITTKAQGDKKADANIKKIENKINKKLSEFIYGYGDETLESVTGELLIKKKKTISVAESCTGGLVSNLLTNIPGSSKYFVMGITAYSNKIKMSKLNIDKALLKKDGAVSKDVAKAMAENVRQLADTDIGLAVTGIAGPAGGTRKKPVGLVYISMVTRKKKLIKEFAFTGTREEIKLQTAKAALDLLRLNL
ncbi:MAG: competence/damage-inducible protein A [Candidatus Omnitrophica bacterium]|nr:competence/damage-inducible protein A [Candidatus Omnitrophota bacterium]